MHFIMAVQVGREGLLMTDRLCFARDNDVAIVTVPREVTQVVRSALAKRCDEGRHRYVCNLPDRGNTHSFELFCGDFADSPKCAHRQRVKKLKCLSSVD